MIPTTWITFNQWLMNCFSPKYLKKQLQSRSTLTFPTKICLKNSSLVSVPLTASRQSCSKSVTICWWQWTLESSQYSSSSISVQLLTTSLPDKLVSIGFTGAPFSWLNSSLFSHTQFETLKTFRSQHTPVTTWVRPGSAVGPLLFFIYLLPLGHNFIKFGFHFHCSMTTPSSICPPTQTPPFHHPSSLTVSWKLKPSHT